MAIENKLTLLTNILQVSHIDIASNIKNEIKEGNAKPLEIYLALKKMEKIVTDVKDDKEIKEIVLEDAQKHVEKGSTFDYMGAKLGVQAVHTYYNFKASNCPYYNELKVIEKKLKNLIKQRETQLKTLIPSDNSLTTGRVKQLIQHMPHFELTDYEEDAIIDPPIKMQKTGVKVTFKKY